MFALTYQFEEIKRHSENENINIYNDTHTNLITTIIHLIHASPCKSPPISLPRIMINFLLNSLSGSVVKMLLLDHCSKHRPPQIFTAQIRTVQYTPEPHHSIPLFCLLLLLLLLFYQDCDMTHLKNTKASSILADATTFRTSFCAFWFQ